MRAEYKYPLIVLVIGLCALGISAFLMRSSRWEPVNFPVNLEQGMTQSQQFSVGMDAEYLVELEADRALPFEQLNCLLGVDPGAPIPCDGVSPVELIWQVTSANPNGVVAAGDSREHESGAWGDRVSRTMGSFTAKKSHEYVLKVVSKRDGSALMPAHPRVVVRQHPLHSKGHALVAQPLFWFGVVMVVVALVWLVCWHSRLRST
jgi:hypothetical protein